MIRVDIYLRLEKKENKNALRIKKQTHRTVSGRHDISCVGLPYTHLSSKSGPQNCLSSGCVLFLRGCSRSVEHAVMAFSSTERVMVLMAVDYANCGRSMLRRID